MTSRASPALGYEIDRLNSKIVLICIIISFGTLVLPVLLTHMPPLVDYPNHLARLWLLSGGMEQAPLNSMYALDWSGASTNVGIDLLAVTIGKFIGGWNLAVLLLMVAVCLPPIGAMLLSREIFGRYHWWQTGFAVLAWNGTLLMGFLGFQASLGLTLVAVVSVSVISRSCGVVSLAMSRMILGAALLVFHPFGAVFFGVLLAGIAFGPEGPVLAAGLAKRLWRALTAAAWGFGIPFLAFLLLAPRLPGGHAPVGVYNEWNGYDVIHKISVFLSAISTYNLRFDILTLVVLWAAARLAACSQSFRYHRGLFSAALVLCMLTILSPSVLSGTAYIDWRFPPMAILTFAAAIQPNMRSVRAEQTMAVALMLLALTRTIWIESIWTQCQPDEAAVEEVLAFVPAGAAVLPAEHTGLSNGYIPICRQSSLGGPFFSHLYALTVPLRRAFIPLLFTAPGKQPLRVLPPWSDISTIEGKAAPVSYLRTLPPPPWTVKLKYLYSYLGDWRTRFDYVLVLNANQPDLDDEASLPGLKLLADRGFARIYKIVPEINVDK